VANLGAVQRDIPDVTVVGAGVSGLTTAICLAEAGVAVAIHAAEPPLHTTSVAAGALWGPHLVGADERIARWASQTLDTLRELSASAHPFARMASGIAASRKADSAPPEFAAEAAGLSACAAGEVPAGYRSAWRFTAPLVSMPDYLEYLHDRYLRAGGRPVALVSYPVLADAIGGAGSPVIINCTGCGARGLVPDPEVNAVRGQVVVTANPGIAGFFVGTGSAQGDLTYYFPHGDRIVLGGTEQLGNWSREPDPRIARQIIAACTEVEPALRGAEVIEHRVGLRPVRPLVRLEAARAANGITIVHNYGHGGAGVTLSWGCAQDAAALAMAALR
jgi:D-amino-acid oxidase